MMHKWLVRLHAFAFSWRHLWTEELIALVLVLFVFIAPASAAMRFQERSLFVANNEPGVTTAYTLKFRYMSPVAVGSVEMLFCNDPIPYHPCVTPTGLDASNALLAAQSGETGFSIQSKTANRIVLTRSPEPITTNGSSYQFSNIKNSTDTSQAFSIRLKSHATSNATGPQVDFGSVRSQIQSGVVIQTQVPPMLVFCLAEEVVDNCGGTNEVFYTDMGEMESNSTLTAQSQMAVGTNASGGFAITANGPSLSAGTNVVDTPTSPTESKQGTNQFGINLVANNAPTVGKDPEGQWANAVASPEYSVPNKYKYESGDVVAFSPNVSLMKKFTVSYIVNASNSLRPGVYTTTINYVATGRF